MSHSNCKWLFFAVKYGAPYGGIRDSEQLRRDTIWGYPEYGASSCVCYTVSHRLDELKHFTNMTFLLFYMRLITNCADNFVRRVYITS